MPDLEVTRHYNRVTAQVRAASKHHRLPKRSWFWRADEHKKSVDAWTWGYNPRG
jgi:hypothetical protein